jgi:hypothetical protein
MQPDEYLQLNDESLREFDWQERGWLRTAMDDFNTGLKNTTEARTGYEHYVRNLGDIIRHGQRPSSCEPYPETQRSENCQPLEARKPIQAIPYVRARTAQPVEQLRIEGQDYGYWGGSRSC